jgi:outer membrane receptor protein involved in Fe transport
MLRSLIGGAALVACMATGAAPSRAQAPADSTVRGRVIDASTHAPLEDASVVLRSRSDSTRVLGTVTNKAGEFVISRVPPGAYVLECSLIGHKSFRSPELVLDAAHPGANLRTISLKPSALVLDEVVISSERSLFNNSIDRRVYNIDHDLMARSSSVSDMLQNIPSVQVDIDGNVSLRGSTAVMVLINGRKSALMGKSRADVLQQLPAASIEKIEVITNPSAKFTPEGTSGIINIVTKKGAGAGLNGDVTGHLGTSDRHNENLSFGYHPGKLELFGNYSYRDDRRKRVGTDVRTLTGAGVVQGYREDNQIAMRPLVHMGTLGLSYRADPKNTIELSGDYFRRRPTRNGLSSIVTRDGAGAILTDHDRWQTGYELESESGVTAAVEHDFAEDHVLRLEANLSDTPQKEPAHFVEHWRTPAQPDPASDVVLAQTERMGHLAIDYSDHVGEHSKLEAGYALERHRQDIRSDADSLDVIQGIFFANPAKTYRFRLDQAIHALYVTYERPLGKLHVLGGLRGEYARVSSDLVSGALPFSDTYSGLYPTLHLAYPASARGEYQINYSRRIRRPESEDLNPFPEYTDPYNIDSGNPRLRPESIHSFELGYRLTGDHYTLAPTLYFRDRRDGFTRLTTAINDTTFLRTMANLASDRSAGFEPVVTLSVGHALQANLNGNVFYDEIDASNLGYAGKRTVVSWSGTFNVTLTPHASTMFEVSSNYRSARLTPQGDARPSFGLNAGVRQGLLHDRLSFTLAVSDVFRTQLQDTQLDVSGIRQRVTNRRDSRIVFVGLTYHYGRPAKSEKKDKPIQYEDSP